MRLKAGTTLFTKPGPALDLAGGPWLADLGKHARMSKCEPWVADILTSKEKPKSLIFLGYLPILKNWVKKKKHPGQRKVVSELVAASGLPF